MMAAALSKNYARFGFGIGAIVGAGGASAGIIARRLCYRTKNMHISGFALMGAAINIRAAILLPRPKSCAVRLSVCLFRP